ncbi:MAG: ATP-binding protein [Desulfobacteraceae bacterium]|jgi:signal transduction histidine kinase
MTSFVSEHIEVEPFDREYQISELLPKDLLERITHELSPLLPEQWALYTANGTIHDQFGPWRHGQTDKLETKIMQDRPEGQTTIKMGNGVRFLLLPIEYELEVMGYMAVRVPDNAQERIIEKSRAGANLLKQLIRLKHQTMLTSGLHGLVVEESYAEIKNKAEQLARSEEKYRNLSANLEIEVQNKTEEIRIAHAHMMQQEKMAAIGQLSAGMAHEINNPLGFILSNLNTLKDYGDDLDALMQQYRHLTALCGDDAHNGCLSAIRSQCKTIEAKENELDGAFLLADLPVLISESLTGAKRIQKIVQDLKTAARPGEYQQEPINVHESIDAVLTIVQNRVAPGISVNRVFHPVPMIIGYPQEISQVWFNLIVNALEAMDAEGTLEITTRTANDRVAVGIIDTGTGIAAENMAKIFDPFFTTKAVGQGTGLGLHLVYQLIAKHAGQIKVQSESGKGSRFTVHLPAAKG